MKIPSGFSERERGGFAGNKKRPWTNGDGCNNCSNETERLRKKEREKIENENDDEDTNEEGSGVGKAGGRNEKKQRVDERRGLVRGTVG